MMDMQFCEYTKAIELYKLHERILCYMMHISINFFFLRNNKGIFCVPFTQFLPMELACKTMVWETIDPRMLRLVQPPLLFRFPQICLYFSVCLLFSLSLCLCVLFYIFWSQILVCDICDNVTARHHHSQDTKWNTASFKALFTLVSV